MARRKNIRKGNNFDNANLMNGRDFRARRRMAAHAAKACGRGSENQSPVSTPEKRFQNKEFVDATDGR